MPDQVVHSGRFSREQRAESIQQYLPVDVPAGAAGLEVTLHYDRDAGVLDLGCLDADGFRGYSGGARDRFAITAAAATPGYRPGPLPAGRWQVIVGLHRVAAEGVGYELTARVGAVEVGRTPEPPPTPDRPPRRDLPAPTGMRWLAGDLHAHTVHSDGSLTIDELACLAVGQGLDFLAVTDHNTTSHHPHLAAVGARHGITLLPGQEVTTDTGHANAFGDIGWIDFREPAQAWVDTTAARGGLLSINHPLAGDCAWRQPLARRPSLAEIWHWSWLDTRWGGPVAWWEAWDRGVVPVGGSDFHDPAEGHHPGRPTTWVLCADDGVDGVLAGLAAGRTAVSAGRDAPVLLRVRDELIALDADGTLLVGPDGRRRAVRGDRFRADGTAGPHRLDDHDGGVVALCG